MKNQGYISADEQEAALADNVYDRIQRNNNTVLANGQNVQNTAILQTS